jgi:hypothetical protein
MVEEAATEIPISTRGAGNTLITMANVISFFSKVRRSSLVWGWLCTSGRRSDTACHSFPVSRFALVRMFSKWQASQGVYYLNGVAGADLPAVFPGFAFSHTQPTEKQHVVDVHLGGHEHIKIKTYKDFVSVLV